MPAGHYAIPPKRSNLGKKRTNSPRVVSPGVTVKRWNFEKRASVGSLSFRGTPLQASPVRWPSSRRPLSARSSSSTSHRRMAGSNIPYPTADAPPISARRVSDARKFIKIEDEPRSARARLTTTAMEKTTKEAWGGGKSSASHHKVSSNNLSSAMETGAFRSPALRMEVLLAERLQKIDQNNGNGRDENDDDDTDVAARENAKFEVAETMIFHISSPIPTTKGSVKNQVRIAYENRLNRERRMNGAAEEKNDAAQDEIVRSRNHAERLKEENDTFRAQIIELKEESSRLRENAKDALLSNEMKTKRKSSTASSYTEEGDDGDEKIRSLKNKIKDLKFKVLQLRTEPGDISVKAASDLRAKLEMQRMLHENNSLKANWIQEEEGKASSLLPEDVEHDDSPTTLESRFAVDLKMRGSFTEEDEDDDVLSPPQTARGSGAPLSHHRTRETVKKIVTIPNSKPTSAGKDTKHINHKVDTWRKPPAR
eukprot:jgi/Bigna1/91783/estExt_fgenesh1_pg.C_1190007